MVTCSKVLNPAEVDMLTIYPPNGTAVASPKSVSNGNSQYRLICSGTFTTALKLSGSEGKLIAGLVTPAAGCHLLSARTSS